MIELTVDGTRANIVISQRKRLNAINRVMWRQLLDALNTAIKDDAIRVLCLRGDGDESFSSGGDISEYQGLSENIDFALNYHQLFTEVLATLRAAPKPTLAAISGYCIGAGLTLATACDFRVGTRSARFGITAVKRGLVYPIESTAELMELVGIQIVRALILSGRQLDAAEAMRVGLLDEVVEPGSLAAALDDWAGRMVASGGRPFEIAKAVIREACPLPRENEAIRALHAEAFGSEAFTLGIRNFMGGNSR
jgi:enoyl-CoA hydratase